MPASRVHRQRGFSLIIVFLVIVLLIGVGGAVILSTQTDLAVAGRDREATLALYAAEAGVAYGKDYLYGKATGVGPGAWDTVLGTAGILLCTPKNGAEPGTQPQAQNAATQYDKPNGQSYVFCIHNNAIDPNYFLNVPTGDAKDGDGIIVIESYGMGPNGARSHLTVELKNGAIAVPRGYDYSQGSSGTLKNANAEGGGPSQLGTGVTF